MYKRKTYNEVQHTNDSDSDDSVEEPNWREHYEQESKEETSDSEEEEEEVARDDEEEEEEEKAVSKSSKLGPKKEFAALGKSAVHQKENVQADEEDEVDEEDDGGSKRAPYFEALRCLACPKILLINAASLENHVNSKRHRIAAKKFAKREEEPEEDLDLIRPAHEVDALGRHGEEEVETHAERTARLRKFAMSSEPGLNVGGLSRKEKKQLAGRQRQKLRKERKKQKLEKAATTKQRS